MPHHHTARRHRPLSIVSDALPDVRINGVGTMPMTDEQYAAAVRALAALIETWRATRTEPIETDRPLAA